MTPPSPFLPAGLRTPLLASILLALLPLLFQLPWALAACLAAAWAVTGWLSRHQSPPAIWRLLLLAVVLAAIVHWMGWRPGRDTGCALLAAMLAIKGCELRSIRDAYSLLGFALFCPFAAFLLDQGPQTLILGLIAAVALLGCLSRLTAHLPSDAPLARPAKPINTRLAGMLLLLALPIALAGFWLIPRLHAPLWGLPDRALSTPGLSDSLSPGQWLDLMVDDSPALRVRFHGPVPTPEQRYWRGPVLSDFDGHTWRRAPRGTAVGAEPRPPSPSAPPDWHYTMDYEPTEQQALVALEQLAQPPSGAHLDAEGSLWSQTPLIRLSQWTLSATAAPRPATPLTAQQRAYFLFLPDGTDPRTRALGNQWRQQTGGQTQAIVQRALDWIGRDFAYTLSTPPPPRHHPADAFLFDRKAGYCEHFSSAFAVLMRSAGIPSRVVTGYAGGIRNRYGDYWVVRKMDAHAWNEVWIENQGWTRVDPTAAVAPENILDTLEDRLAARTLANDGLLPVLGERWQALREAGDWMRQRWNQQFLGYDAAAQRRLMHRLGQRGNAPAGTLITLWLGISVLLAGGLWWLLSRPHAHRDPLHHAWHTLGKRHQKRQLQPQPHETARTWARRTAPFLRNADALQVLAERYERVRYALTPDPALLKDLRRYRPDWR